MRSSGSAKPANVILCVVAAIGLVWMYDNQEPRAQAPKAITSGGSGHHQIPPGRVAQIETGGKLRVDSWRCYREHSYQHVAGVVTNITTARLENVTAVATFETKDGKFVKTDKALIDYQPLMPGQTSPFEVLSTDNPEIAGCSLTFQHLFGAAIPIEQ